MARREAAARGEPRSPRRAAAQSRRRARRAVGGYPVRGHGPRPSAVPPTAAVPRAGLPVGRRRGAGARRQSPSRTSSSPSSLPRGARSARAGPSPQRGRSRGVPRACSPPHVLVERRLVELVGGLRPQRRALADAEDRAARAQQVADAVGEPLPLAADLARHPGRDEGAHAPVALVARLDHVVDVAAP